MVHFQQVTLVRRAEITVTEQSVRGSYSGQKRHLVETKISQVHKLIHW